MKQYLKYLTNRYYFILCLNKVNLHIFLRSLKVKVMNNAVGGAQRKQKYLTLGLGVFLFITNFTIYIINIY